MTAAEETAREWADFLEVTSRMDLRSRVKLALKRFGPRLTLSELRQATGSHSEPLDACLNSRAGRLMFLTVRDGRGRTYVEVRDTYR